MSYVYSCKMSTFPHFLPLNKKKSCDLEEKRAASLASRKRSYRINQLQEGCSSLESSHVEKALENAATQQNVMLGRITALLKGSVGVFLWVPMETLMVNCYYERNDSLWCIRCSLSNFILMTIFCMQYAEPECFAAEIFLIILQNTHTHTHASTTSVVCNTA